MSNNILLFAEDERVITGKLKNIFVQETYVNIKEVQYIELRVI